VKRSQWALCPIWWMFLEELVEKLCAAFHDYKATIIRPGFGDCSLSQHYFVSCDERNGTYG
jgi:hypothetical protein